MPNPSVPDVPSLPRMVLVECREAMRAGLGAWLQQEFPAYRIDTVASGDRAQWIAARRPPALMPVDIDARQGQGLGVAGRLQALSRKAPIVALSLFHGMHRGASAIQAGAVACARIAWEDDSPGDLLHRLLRTSQAGTA